MADEQLQIKKQQEEFKVELEQSGWVDVTTEDVEQVEKEAAFKNEIEEKYENILITDYYGVKDMDMKSYANILGHAPVLMHKPEKSVFETEYTTKFSVSLSDKKRAEKQKNVKSRLYHKLENDKKLKGLDGKITDTNYKAMLEFLPWDIVEYDTEETAALAAFMGAVKEENKKLVRLYEGKDKNRAGQGRDAAMDDMLKLLFGTPLDKLRLDNDREIANNAVWLETFSQRMKAFDFLAQKHSYFDKLREKLSDDEYAGVENKMMQLRSIAAYYDTRKEIIQNDLYKNRYNKELSMDPSAAKTPEEQELADLLLRSYCQHIEMLRKNGVPETEIAKIKKPSFKKKAEGERLLKTYSDKVKITDVKIQASARAFAENVGKTDLADRIKDMQHRKEQQDLAATNLIRDYAPEDKRLSKDVRDEEYNEEALKQTLSEFEKFDLGTVKFDDNRGILENYAHNMEIFEYVRKVHYDLFRGIAAGFKADDEQLIALRAKFRCAFEMEDYMTHLNRMVFDGDVDLSADNEETWQIMEQHLNSLERRHRTVRQLTGPVNPNEHLQKCLENIREEYNNRENVIKEVYGSLERKDIPEEVLAKKMDAYETNAVAQEYLLRRNNRFFQHSAGDAISAYNLKNDEKLSTSMTRLDLNFLYGKTVEEQAKYTKMMHGTPHERLLCFRQMIEGIHAIDKSEFDTRDLGKFYKDAERKFVALSITANSKDIASGVIAATKELQKEEIAKNPKMRPVLPKELEGLGYTNMDELVKDMFVMQEWGNAVAGKLDGIAQVAMGSSLPVMSLLELNSANAETMNRWKNNIAYLDEEEVERDLTDSEKWTQNFIGQLEFSCMEIETRKVTKKEQKKGKLTPTMTYDVDVLEIYKEEEEAYFRKAVYASLVKRNRPKEVEDAKALVKYKNDNIKMAEARMNKMGLTAKEEQGDINKRKVKFNRRLLVSYSGGMNVLRGDTEEKTKERIKTINIHLPTATKEQKQKLAREMEDSFALIMNFNLSELNFDTFADICNKDRYKTRAMVQFCFDYNDLFDRYQKLIEDPQVDTLLDKEEFLEVRTKKQFLVGVNQIYLLSESMSDPEFKDYDIPSLLYLTDKEFEELIGASPMKHQPMLIQFFGLRSEFSKNGILPGADFEEIFKKDRQTDPKAQKVDMSKHVLQKLNKR